MKLGGGVFDNYSKYYDLLYRDKDYSGEIAFITQLLERYGAGMRDILELGCGTGLHASLLAEKGYVVHGVDLSASMLEAAATRQAGLPREVAGRLEFSPGDVRDYRAERIFDAVLSLFHVVSYQSTNDDLLAMFKNVAGHLRKGGVFVFDYWYTPAVYTHRPTVRVKRMSSPEISVTRIAEPTVYAADSLVDVVYDIAIQDLKTGNVERLRETHRMRHLSSTEIDLLARQCGLKVVESGGWLTGEAPSEDSWGVYSVLAK